MLRKVVKQWNGGIPKFLSGNVKVVCFSQVKSMHSVKDYFVDKTPITAQLWQMRKADDRLDDTESGIVSFSNQSLIVRTSEQSRLTLCYGFGKDSHMRDLYVDHTGNILTGKLLEDLDALAGNVANRHCCDENLLTKRLSLVTASVDEIIQSRPIPTTEDLVLTGHVVWVGKSSLDVNVEIHRAADYKGPGIAGNNEKSRLLSSTFTYVARHRDTGKAAMVNPLQISSPAEQDVYNERAAAADLRKAQRDSPPVAPIEETAALQRLIEEGSAMQDMPALGHRNAILMKHTGLENSVVCQPQNVNTGGRVFGGFIMHRAFDLALSTSYIFSGAYPIFLEVDKIAFRRPVDIGDLLRLKSRVIYSSANPHTATATTTANTTTTNTAAATGSAHSVVDNPADNCHVAGGNSGIIGGVSLRNSHTAAVDPTKTAMADKADKPLLVVEVSCQVVRPESACSFVSNTFYFVFGFPEGHPVSLRKVLPVTAEEASMLIAGSAAVQSSLDTISAHCCGNN